MIETIAGVERYTLQHAPFLQLDNRTLAAWQAICGHSAPQCDPTWLRGYFAGQLDRLEVYCLYENGALCGVVPFLIKDWPLKWHLGEVTIAKLPLRRFRLLGNTLNIPEVRAAYDLLFNDIAKAKGPFDSIQLEEVPLESFLWNYLHTSPLVRNSFRIYLPEPPSPHLLLRFSGSYEEYLSRLKGSPKHRKELLRDVKKVREGKLGSTRFVKYTKPEEVPLFLEAATEVSRKTYQWTLHERGLSARDVLRQRMLFAAQQDWLRAYVLVCNDSPCAFQVGIQHHGTFLPLETAYDPALSKYRVGLVVQLMAIEDLFSQNCAEVIDYGDYGSYKEMLSNESYMQGKVMLFRPGAYARLVQGGHRACRAATTRVSSLLEHVRWKSKIKKIIRNWSMSKAKPVPHP